MAGIKIQNALQFYPRGHSSRNVKPPLHLTNACRSHNLQLKISCYYSYSRHAEQMPSRSLARSFVRNFLTCVSFDVFLTWLIYGLFHCLWVLYGANYRKIMKITNKLHIQNLEKYLNIVKNKWFNKIKDT